MAHTIRTLSASLLALAGSIAVYYGALINLYTLGGTLGSVAIVPGALLLSLAPLPIRTLPPNRRRSILVGILRYLSLPVFLLGAFFILVGGLPMLFEGSSVSGLASGLLITLAGLFAITWPELLARLPRASGMGHHKAKCSAHRDS